jgi:uncharacterized protein (TIGR00255 family)
MAASGSLRSMTGFARSSGAFGGVEAAVEIRSVNHRFLEVNLKLPRCYSHCEREIKSLIQQSHRRGRIDLFISRVGEPLAGKSGEYEFSRQFDESVRAYAAACRRYGASGQGLESFIAQLLFREAGAQEEPPPLSTEEQAWIFSLVQDASMRLAEMRTTEGVALASELSGRIEALKRYRKDVVDRSLTAPARLRERMHERLAALAPEIAVNPDRLAQEVALLADRVDISEELSRLDIHLTQFAALVRDGHSDGIGRKLDFMTQEIGRELNTVASKAQDAHVQGIVVEAKAELERIREQVQNVE